MANLQDAGGHAPRKAHPSAPGIFESKFPKDAPDFQPIRAFARRYIAGIAAPNVVRQRGGLKIVSLHANGIQMDVVCGGQEVVRRRIDGNRLVAAGEEMTPRPVRGVEPLGVGALQPLHAGHQIRLGGFQQQVVVVPHQHIGVDPPPRASADLAKRRQKTRAIRIRPEHGLAMVAAAHGVVDRAGVFQPRFPCHDAITEFFRRKRQAESLIHETDPL